MNIEFFKAEFAKFLHRYIKPCNDTNFETSVTPLTNQEILEAVNDVINSKFDETLVDWIQADFQTPAAGIIVTTPDAPDIPKINVDHTENGGMPGRFRSLDTLTSESLTDSSINQLMLSEPDELKSKMDSNIGGVNLDLPNAQLVRKKAMSKSSPSMSMLVRSDTYVFNEVDPENEFNNNVFSEKKIEPVAISGPGCVDSLLLNFNSSDVVKKLKALKHSATEVVKQIGELEGSIFTPLNKFGADNSRPIRRLSAIGGFPGLNRASTSVRTIQRPKTTRRSMAAFPGTPTSSRLSPGEAKSETARRKSTSTISAVQNGGTKMTIPLTHRSISSGALSVPKKSPASCASLAQSSRVAGNWGQKSPIIRASSLSLMSERNDGRQPKNPKYAHVQSTLPKLGKRKAN